MKILFSFTFFTGRNIFEDLPEDIFKTVRTYTEKETGEEKIVGILGITVGPENIFKDFIDHLLPFGRLFRITVHSRRDCSLCTCIINLGINLLFLLCT